MILGLNIFCTYYAILIFSKNQRENIVELKDFIKTTIMDIATAIEEANTEALGGSVDVLVNPSPITKMGEHYESYVPHTPDTNRKVEMIDFDVAVTSSASAEGGAETGINIAGFKIGADGSIAEGNENVSRIKFQIPVRLPYIKSR